MKITDHFKNAEGKTLISFEVLPPLKGGSMSDIFETLDPLMEFKPPFIDVTYHREEFVYNKRYSPLGISWTTRSNNSFVQSTECDHNINELRR